ncbi:MAG: TMEM175 family protein [Nakamurella sp.]
MTDSTEARDDQPRLAVSSAGAPGKGRESATGHPSGTEGDEVTDPDPDGAGQDNSLGRLFALSDGVFAIAMTLLALDLIVPASSAHVDDQALRHILVENIPSYLSFLLSFYVVATYWIRHRQVMKSVATTHPKINRDTLVLLLLVAAMPFPASLLGQYASDGTSLAVYGLFNLLATLMIIQLTHDVRNLRLTTNRSDLSATSDQSLENWGNAVVFLLCIPAGYIFGGKGSLVLILLFVAGHGPSVRRRLVRARQARADRRGAATASS